MPGVWTLATIVVKTALYFGVLTSAGTVLVGLVFGITLPRRLVVLSALMGLAATLCLFLLGGARLTGDASGLTDPVMLGLLWDTPRGTALVLRLVGLSAVVAGVLWGGRGLWVAAAGGLLALTSFAQFGHVPDHGAFWLPLALVLHLSCIALWIGVLAPLGTRAANPETLNEAADLGHRFGRVAMVTVPLLILLGAVISYRLLGTWAALLSTGYGQALLLKTGGVAVLLALAALNKLRFVPALKLGDHAAGAHLSKTVSWEWAAFLGILTTTATLTSTLTLPQ